MTDIFEVDLFSYRDCLGDGRLLVSEVLPNDIVHPFDILTNLDELLQNVSDYKASQALATRIQQVISQKLRESKGHSTGYPFIGSAKLRGTPFSVSVRRLDEDTLKHGSCIVQSPSLFDLIKGHSSNSAFLDFLLTSHKEIVKLAREFLAKFKLLHPSAAESCTSFPVVLAGVRNSRQFYAMTEVRAPGFLIHSLNINNSWQSLSQYDHVAFGGRSNIYTVANIHATPWVFLKPEDGGHSFLQEARRLVRDLEKKDDVWKATFGMIFTPVRSAGLPNNRRFWFKVIPENPGPSELDARCAEHIRDRQEEEAKQHEELRVKAQIFAEKVCTYERLQKCWYAALGNDPESHVPTRHVVAAFMNEMHRLEREDVDQNEWANVDWTKAYPRVDRIAKAWALARIQSVTNGPNHRSDDEWEDVMDQDVALENTRDLRRDPGLFD